MENLLLDALVEGVRHGADEHSLRQRGNFRGRDKRIHLRIDGGGFVAAVYGDTLSLLQHFAKTFGQVLCRLSHDLPGKDIADCVHYDLGLLVAVVAD